MTVVQGQQTKIEVDDGTGTFNAISQVTDIGEPGSGDATAIEETDFDDTVKKFQKGLIERGTFSFTVNYDPADTQHQRLDTLDGNTDTTSFKVILSDSSNTEIQFDAFVTSFPKSPQFDDLVTATCNLQITGGITIV